MGPLPESLPPPPVPLSVPLPAALDAVEPQPSPASPAAMSDASAIPPLVKSLRFILERIVPLRRSAAIRLPRVPLVKAVNVSDEWLNILFLIVRVHDERLTIPLLTVDVHEEWLK